MGRPKLRRGVIHEFRTELAFALEMQQGTLIGLVVSKERFSVTRLTFAGEDLFRVWETASISVGTRLGSSYPMV